MSTVQSIFPMVSVRNPWGYLIQNGFKTIENRKKQLSKDFHNIWIALHVAKTFKTQEEKYAQKYLKNHASLLTKTIHSKQKVQASINTFFHNTSFKLNNRQKINKLITAELKPQLGQIIALIKISKCVNSSIGKTIDSLYCDEPYEANSHWVISNVIPLKSNEYLSTRGYPGVQKIKDTLLNKLLSNILIKKLKEINNNNNKQNESQENKEIETDTQTQSNIEEDDEDILDIMNELDNVISQSQSQSHTQKEDTIDNFASDFISPKSKKRKRKEIVQSDDDNDNYSPAPKKTKINMNKLKINDISNSKPVNVKRKLPAFVTGNNSNNCGGFSKFSKHNSFYDMKRNDNKINLMIIHEKDTHMKDNNNSDIDTELDLMLEQTRKEKNKNETENKIRNKISNKILFNPNELRRKAHLCLPNEYCHRIIVFDTETACFKPEGVIIDIGAVELINGRLTGRKFQSYIKPWAKIHDMAMKIHGITERFLNNYADGDIYQIIQSFMEWINSDCICNQCKNLKLNEINRKHEMKLVGHNVQFDIRHLNGAINYCQNKMEKKIWNNIQIENTFDTQIYFRNVLGNVSNYSLDAMCQKFGVRTDGRKHLHGALVDAMCTAKCLQEMWKRDKDVKDRKCKNRFFTKKL